MRVRVELLPAFMALWDLMLSLLLVRRQKTHRSPSPLLSWCLSPSSPWPTLASPPPLPSCCHTTSRMLQLLSHLHSTTPACPGLGGLSVLELCLVSPPLCLVPCSPSRGCSTPWPQTGSFPESWPRSTPLSKPLLAPHFSLAA